MAAESGGEAEAEAADPGQKRKTEFDYTLLTEAPKDSFFCVVMMKSGQRPQTKRMQDELLHGNASANVAQYVSVATGAGCSYVDVRSLTGNLHGKQSRGQKEDCRKAAEEHGLANLSVPGGSSYLSRDVNVLYEGTADHGRLMGDFQWDVGAAVQGVHQYVCSGKYTSDTAARQIGGRGNIQCTFGISNHNYDDSKSAQSGEVAALDVQGEVILHRYFPNRGREVGVALAKLAEIRDALARERGDGSSEYSDTVRNQVFSGRTGQMFGLPTVGFESVSVGLTGRSQTLEEMRTKMLEKLPSWQRRQATTGEGGNEGAVETADHADTLNPADTGDGYSRVVLGKWPIQLAKDPEGDFVEVTLIGNQRAAVATYRDKMRGIRGLSDWIGGKFEERREQEQQQPTGHMQYEADGDLLAHGGSSLCLGFVPNETEGIDSRSLTTHGPGGFVSYSRPLLSEKSPWRRHRRTILQRDTADLKRKQNGKRKRKRKRSDEGQDDDFDVAAPVPDKELAALRKQSALCGELLMKRADFNRFADLSGPIWAVEELRDKYELNEGQVRQLSLCILWHARSRAIFLLKCWVLLRDRDSTWATDFAKIARREPPRPGALGSFIMHMVDLKLVGRMASELIRAHSYHLPWQSGGEEDCFSPTFVHEQSKRLKGFLREAEKLKPSTSTADFLRRHVGRLAHVGQFVLPQALPVCYLLGLAKCDAARAAEAPILDEEKQHYRKFLRLGVDPKFFDLSVLVVALQFGTTPGTIENTGCEGVRRQTDAHDFMLEGQLFYDLRPDPNCNYRHPQYVVHVKEWGAQGKWVPVVRDKTTGRWAAASAPS